MASHRLIKESFIKNIPEGCSIIEIGVGRVGWDKIPMKANSTIYFDFLAKKHDKDFISVDFNPEMVEYSKQYVGDRCIYAEGTAFLNDFEGQISALYLDNYDVVYSDKHGKTLDKYKEVYGAFGYEIKANNEESAAVHLSQLKAALPKMHAKGVICLDDTLLKNGKWWGKGATCVPYLIDLGWKIVAKCQNGVILNK